MNEMSCEEYKKISEFIRNYGEIMLTFDEKL